VETLKEWLLSICAFTMISTVLYLLLPRDRISETVKTVLRFVLLLLIFLPLCYSDFISDESLSTFFLIDEKRIAEQVTGSIDLLKDETEHVVCAQAASVLAAYYDGPHKIETDTDILSDMCIHIKQIRIILFSETNNMSELQKALESFFPTCEIVIEQEVKNEES